MRATTYKELRDIRFKNNFGLLRENNLGIQFYFWTFGEREWLFYFFLVCVGDLENSLTCI